MKSCWEQLREIEENYAELISNEIITIGPNLCPEDLANKNMVEMWNSDFVFSQDLGKLEEEENLPQDRVIYPSHAGKRGRLCHTLRDKTYILQGKRCRLYLDIYTHNPLKNSYIIAYVEKDGDVDNVSFKFGNHEDMVIQEEGPWHFGGYGGSFHEDFAESKVEYVHSDGDNEGEAVKKSLPEPLDPNKIYGYKCECQNLVGKREKIMKMYIDYDGDKSNPSPNWKNVLTRKWDDDNWDKEIDFGGKTGRDLDEVKKGVYNGLSHRWWIRDNPSGSSGILKIYRIAIGEMGDFRPRLSS